MKPHYLIALKNIRRNKGRTFVTTILTAVSTAILIFLTAFLDGSHQTFLRSSVELYPSYIQITNKDFKDDPGFENIIRNSSILVNELSKNPKIQVLTQRFENFVLLSSDTKSLGSMIVGIEPQKEEQVSKLKKSLLFGEYLNTNDTNQVYLGEQLAHNLKVKVGDKISYVGTGVDYSFSADNLYVKGIFATGSYEFDESSAFVNKSYFDKAFISENLSTHIVILPKDITKAQILSDEINKNLPPDLLSQSWQEFMKALVQAMEIDSISGYITMGIFFLVIFFVILIYTLLSIFARTKEIGILRAIGTKQIEIFNMLFFESVVLTFIGVFIGGIIGTSLAYYFYINPLDFGSSYDEQFKQYGLINTAIPTAFEKMTILRDMFIMFILTIASTLYPIFKVNAIKPIEAINHV